MKTKTSNIHKYQTKNPLFKLMMDRFFRDLDSLISEIRDDVDSAIEIGCGEGFIAKHLHDLGINIIGADIDDEILNLAKKLHPEINFVKMNIYELTGKWDLIVCCEVLEHLEDPKRAVKAMKNSAKYLLISVPNEPFFRIANLCRLKYLKCLGNTPGHLNHWTVFSFRNFLRQFGFREVKFKVSTVWQFGLCKL